MPRYRNPARSGHDPRTPPPPRPLVYRSIRRIGPNNPPHPSGVHTMARFPNEQSSRANARANADATRTPWRIFSDTSGVWNSERGAAPPINPSWAGVLVETIYPAQYPTRVDPAPIAIGSHVLVSATVPPIDFPARVVGVKSVYGCERLQIVSDMPPNAPRDQGQRAVWVDANRCRLIPFTLAGTPAE